MKSLPIGFQSIEMIIKNNFTYVDKTGILHELITTPGRYFLSRPRRFGKSLTCSTLEAIFEGKKDLFKGLAISKLDYDWKKYPIVRLDFNGVAHQTIEDMHISLPLALDRIAQDYEVDISAAKLPKDKLNTLIISLAQKYGPVVVIIDEYDKPILDHIHHKDIAIQMREFLKSFYGVLKDKDVDANLRFLFLTGVSKFSKVSIFSELNNLKDLTLDERCAALCGYTQEELEFVFKEHIQGFAEHCKRTKSEMLAELKNWYNGFQFSEKECKVYNPFSILNSLQDKTFRNYWFASGTPTFIMNFAKNNPELVKELIMLEAEAISVNDMEKLSVENYFENMIVLFLQAGYLTISDYDPKSRLFSLSYPNFEIRLSMTEQILELVTKLSSRKLAGFEVRFRDALEADDIETFCRVMQDFFVVLPLTVIIDLEKFYHGIFFTVTKLLGAKIDSEVATNLGYIDAILEGKNNTYVIEFKKGKSPDAALKQIEDKEYFKRFKIESDRPVVLVGMNFKCGKKGVKLDWKIKKV